jgi:hypothetical protein
LSRRNSSIYKGEMAVSQTAYVAYAPILNAELEQLAAAEKE